MIYAKITKHGTGTTDQPCFYLIKRRSVIIGSFGFADKAIWCVQSSGISLRAAGQKEPAFHSGSRTISGLYGKTGPKSYQRDKSSSLIYGVIDQHSSKNGTGRVFIKTRPWRKKRDELNYPALMTGFASKSSHRFTVFLSLTLNAIVS